MLTPKSESNICTNTNTTTPITMTTKSMALFKTLTSMSYDTVMEQDIKMIDTINDAIFNAMSDSDLKPSQIADAVMKFTNARELIKSKYQQEHHLIQLGATRAIQRILEDASLNNRSDVIDYMEDLLESEFTF